jgi:hypothetical protein
MARDGSGLLQGAEHAAPQPLLGNRRSVYRAAGAGRLDLQGCSSTLASCTCARRGGLPAVSCRGAE